VSPVAITLTTCLALLIGLLAGYVIGRAENDGGN
jgi:ABC-type dipeptide/oligopeptide/nickel transport system permease subunit